MTKFIRVTEVMTGGDKKPLLVNTACITHIQGGLDGHNTHIRMTFVNHLGKQAYYFVEETVEQIEAQMMTDYSRPPVLMTAKELAAYEMEYLK